LFVRCGLPLDVPAALLIVPTYAIPGPDISPIPLYRCGHNAVVVFPNNLALRVNSNLHLLGMTQRSGKLNCYILNHIPWKIVLDRGSTFLAAHSLTFGPHKLVFAIIQRSLERNN